MNGQFFGLYTQILTHILDPDSNFLSFVAQKFHFQAEMVGLWGRTMGFRGEGWRNSGAVDFHNNIKFSTVEYIIIRPLAWEG